MLEKKKKKKKREKSTIYIEKKLKARICMKTQKLV